MRLKQCATGASLLVLTALLCAPAAAQVAPNPAQIAPPTRDELVPSPPLTDTRGRTTLSVDGGFERSPCALDNPEFADLRVTLSQVSFAGAEAAADVDLGVAAAPYLGRDLPLAVLCDIRARANAMLADAGYLAAVEIPEQRLSGGVAQFRVVLGRLTALRVRGEAGPSERRLAGYLQKLVGQPVFNTRAAERYLLLADDIPGLDVRLALRPAAGGAPGDLIGEVAVLRRGPAVDLNVQNYGARALGRFGGMLRAELYDITGLGDRTSLSAYTSHDFAEQQTLQLAHDFLVGSEGLSLGGQVTFGWTNPGINLPGFDVKSETLFTGIRASFPLVRRQTRTVGGSAGFDLVDQDVRLNGFDLTRDRVRTAWVRLDWLETDTASIGRRLGYSPFEPRARLALGLEVRQGLGILGASRDCRTAPAACLTANQVPTRIEQDPTPLLARASLRAEYRPVPLFTLAMDVTGQFTRDALPAFEELTGGSYSAGRGYDPASVTGDTGITARLEMRYGTLMPDSVNSVSVQPYVFFDAATLRDRDPSQRAANPDSLASAGGGLRFAYGRGLQGDVALAVPLRRTDTQRLGNLPRGDARLLISITSRLAPWRF